MAVALDQFRIEGINHNIAFLTAIMHNPRFREGALTTGFIAEEYPDGFQAANVPQEGIRRCSSVAAAIKRRYQDRAAKMSGQLPSHE